MPGPSWLTGWVKMNTKHVVFADPKTELLLNDDSGKASQATESTVSSVASAEETSTPRRSRRQRRRSRDAAPPREILERKDRKRAPAEPKSPRSNDITPQISSPRAPLASGDSSLGLGGLFPRQFFGEHQEGCANCAETENKLVAALDDLEFLREVALEAAEKGDKTASETESKEPEVSRVSAASKQLHEVTTRHKKQVQALTRERVRWQQEMHLKLNKFANMCKGLNEESAVLKSECTALQNDLERVQTERDELSEEVLILRAKAAEHERERARFAELEARMLQLEQENLEAKQLIQARDDVVEEMTSQLEQALDHLEVARASTRKRNTFFPVGL